MTRRNNRAGSARRGARSGRRGTTRNPISKVPFHTFGSTTVSGVTGQSTIAFSPRSTAIGTMDALCTQFDLWKCVDLEYRLHPMDPTNTLASMAYYPDIDVQTVTQAQNSGSPTAVAMSPYSGVPSNWMRVPRSMLKGMLDWYKCQADAGAAEFESQGTLVFVCGASDTVVYELRGVIAFKNPVTAALQLDRFRSLVYEDIKKEVLAAVKTGNEKSSDVTPDARRR